MANDPIRKVDPAGLILDWFRKKKKKACCCCCAEDILFQNIEPYQKGFKFGHSFDTVIRLRYVLSRSRGDCKLEWWERSQSSTRRPEDSYNWTDMWKGGSGPKASSFRGWIETPRQCPGIVVLPDSDIPRISTLVRARRELDIIIMAFSTPGCPCRFRKVSITAKQILEVGDNREILSQEFEPGQTRYN